MDAGGVERQVSIAVDDYDNTALDSDGESTAVPDQFNDFAMNGMVRLQEGGEEFSSIKQRFLVAMGNFGTQSDAVAIHKYSSSGVLSHAKKEAFTMFCQAVAAERGGDANVKYGWYGGSRDEICDIISFGFSRCGGFVKDVSHGVGVWLSPEPFTRMSALRAREDANGLRHVLLCQVILGNTERIRAGSEQFRPSSNKFDSGIDDFYVPNKYIIWSAYMNSHIFPQYIISLRFSRPSIGSSRECIIASMFVALSTYVDPSKFDLFNHLVVTCLLKIGTADLGIRLRNLVGENNYTAALNWCRYESIRPASEFVRR